MDDYIKLEQIGSGSAGNQVHKVINLSDKKYYAMKRIEISETNDNQDSKNQNEIQIFQSLKHPNLIQYISSFLDKKKLCIIMEYADNGDLNNIVQSYKKKEKKIDEDIIWNWFLQICQAIRYIHSKKIIHRDIKCQNIFLMKNGLIKVGDFGISKILMNTFGFASTPLGTPYFLSPEICSGSKYNFKIDMWMLGCVLYELSTLKRPFAGKTLPELMKNIREREILPIPKTYSQELQELISKLLCKNPTGRPSIKDILQYDYIVAKMNKYGFTKFYDHWNECPDDLTVNESSPSYSLFNLGYGDLDSLYNDNENEEDVANKLGDMKINDDNVNKKPIQDKGSDSGFGVTINLRTYNEAEFKRYQNNNTAFNKFTAGEIEITENINSSDNIVKEKQKITPTYVVNSSDYWHIFFKFKFFVEKYGKEKMDEFIKLLEDEKGASEKIHNGIKKIFPGLDEKESKRINILGKVICKECKF